MKTIEYTPQGVCSRKMNIAIENGIITSIDIEGGCNGNLQGISLLVTGMPVDLVIDKLRGISCDGKATSCPDQLARALQSAE